MNHHASKPYFMTLCCLGIVAGVCLFQCIAELPDLKWLGLMVCLLVITWRWRRYYLVCLFIGWSWAWIYAAWSLVNRLPVELEGQTLSANTRIESIPSCDKHLCRFNASLTLNQQALPGAGESKRTKTINTRLSWYSPPEHISAGQQWQLDIRLKRPHGLMNPGGFDYEQWLFAHGIGATGYVRCQTDCQLLSNPDRSLRNRLTQHFRHQRQQLYNRLTQYLSASPVSGLLIGMVVGIRDDMTEQQWNVLRQTGTAHLMAISGLHIGLIAGLVFWLIRLLCAWLGIVRWAPQQIAAVAAMLCACGYAVLAGLSLPTQRALIMLAIVFGSVILQTSLRAFHLLTISAFVVVVLNPLAVLETGFWLSFGAVAVISLMLVGRQRFQGYWRTTWAVGWRVALGLGPLLLLFFGNASVIAPIANVVAVPVVSLLVIPFALTGVIASVFSDQLAMIIFDYASLVLESVMWFLEQLAGFRFASISLSKPSLWAAIISIAGVCIVLLPKGIRFRWMGLVMLLPVLYPMKPVIEQGQFKLTVLDVGQGLSSVIETANHTLVFDAGIRLGSGFDIGSMVVLPYLRSQGIRNVNMLVLSHSDIDHIGGAQSLLAGLPVLKTIASDPQQLSIQGVDSCKADQQWVWDGVRFSMLGPMQPYFAGDNNNSCVLQVSSNHHSVLLTGDIEIEAEERLVKHYGQQLNSQVLVVPHHGSQTSSSAVLLAQVKPDLAINSAGYRNRYGFPHQSVVDRYRSMSINLLNTFSSGAVSIALGDKDNLQNVTEYRKKSMRYWNAR